MTLRVVNYIICSGLDTPPSARTRTIFLNSPLLHSEAGEVCKTGKADFGRKSCDSLASSQLQCGKQRLNYVFFLLRFFSFNLLCIKLDQGSYHSKMSLKRWTGLHTLFCMLLLASPAKFLLCNFIIKFHTGLNFGMFQKKMSQEFMKRKIQEHDNGKLMLLVFQKLGWEEEEKCCQWKTFAVLHFFIDLFLANPVPQRDRLNAPYLCQQGQLLQQFPYSPDIQKLARLSNTNSYLEPSFAYKLD